MKFAFELCQRVTVPNSNGVQGVIVTALGAVGAENQYTVNALTDDGKQGVVVYGEAALIAAQKPAAVKR